MKLRSLFTGRSKAERVTNPASAQVAANNYLYLGDGVGVAKTHRGHLILLYSRDYLITPHIGFSGVWEPDVEQAIRSLLARGMTVVEVGCNVGYHTLAMISKIGIAGKLFGIEANPEIFELLWGTITANGMRSHCQLFNRAAVDKAGMVEFDFDPGEAAGGCLVTPNRDKRSRQITVPGEPIDAMLPDVENVDLLRMDAEGSEPLVFRGAKRLIERSPNIRIVTEWSVGMMNYYADVDEFVRELISEGYEAWLIQKSGDFQPISMSELPTLPHCDIVLSRTGLGV